LEPSFPSRPRRKTVTSKRTSIAPFVKQLCFLAGISTLIGCSTPDQQPASASESDAPTEEIEIALDRTANYRMASDVIPSSSIPAGDVVVGTDSFSVGLLDAGSDGVYSFEDRLLVGMHGEEALDLAPGGGAIALHETRFFRAGDRAYQVVALDSAGTSVRVRPADVADIPHALKTGDLVPDVAFATFEGEEKPLSAFIGQTDYLFLDIWATWCPGCHQDVEPIRVLHNDPRVTVLSLNYNESMDTATAFIERYRINWPNGFSTEAINEAFEVKAMPRGVLISSSGEVLIPYIRPNDVLKELDMR
jgi:thiol-disulfide isomerase/thioredoxin